jgi:hypothetical protein
MQTLRLMVVMSVLTFTGIAHADGDLSRANPAQIDIEMGQTDAKHMYFKPNHIDLQTGQACAQERRQGEA